MRGQLPDISPSSGAYRATFPQRGKAYPFRAILRQSPTPRPPQNMCGFLVTTVTPCNNPTKTGRFGGIITKQTAVDLRFCTKTVHQTKTIDRDLPTPNIFCANCRGLLQNSRKMCYNTPINSARCARKINWRNKNVREDS